MRAGSAWSDAQSGGAPVSHTSVDQSITLQAGVDKTVNLPDITDDIPLDGSATVEVIYL